MDEVIIYGPDTVQLKEETTTRYDGLDSVNLEYISSINNLFSSGSPMPGFPNVRIDEIQKRTEPGPDYRYTLMGTGLIEAKGTRVEKGYPKITRNLEGLDEASYSVISTSSTQINRGDTLPGHSNMHCVNATSEEIYTGFYRIQGRYQGLIGTKPYKRSITVNGQTVNPSEPFVNGLPNGWPTPEKGSFNLPKIVVSDFHVFIGQPDTEDIPGNKVPPDAPAVQEIVISGMPLTRVWPYGWTLASIDGSYIAGTNVWGGTYMYEFNYPALPGA